MDRSGAQSRTGSRSREPLSSGTSRANVTATPPGTTRTSRSTKSPSAATTSSIPHHESIPANGARTVRNATSPRDSKKTQQQVSSTPPDEEEEEDKRASQVSNGSSQGSNWAHRKKRIGPWLLGKDIGRGMVGKVRKVKHVHTGQIAAAKIIPKKMADEMRAESLMNLALTTAGNQNTGVVLPLGIEREVVIMKLLEHPNVVKLYDVWENRSELYLIMELVEDGELFEYVTRYQNLEEDETVYIFRQIVAALLNAHRLGIYHRDLKPENILIDIVNDPETGRFDPQVKLADFGMAALQPKGKFLSTACGSVHYAAPEVFEKQYDGSKADVWSLGIILYVMLTGMLPFPEFGGEDKNVYWYRSIKAGRYTEADWLSEEAQDLIKRMIVPNPRRRISLEAVWNHPLFEKWSLAWGETDEDRNLLSWIGAAPTITNWTVKTERDIDREIFRNLRVLWHSEKEDILKKRLLSNERNFEKLFYSSLLRYREEQLENYMSTAEDLSVSASDHHHMKPTMDPTELPPLPPAAYTRTKSSLSIMHDDRPKSKTGTQKSSPSERSYDPYRSSKNPIVSNRENFTVTVHRGSSRHSRKHSGSPSLKAPSTRVDTLKKEQKRLSTGSSSARLSRQTSPSARPISRRSMSRSSVVTSVYPSSPPGPIVIRPRSAHKRGVDFSHVRRSSTVSALPSSPTKPNISSVARRKNAARRPKSAGKGKAPVLQTPVASASNIELDKPDASTASPPYRRETPVDPEQAKVRKSKTHSQVINSEARKVSVELEKFCEEAFNRNSNGSSYATTTATTQAMSAYDTPPSSVSNNGSAYSSQGLTTPEHRSWHRAEGIGETPNTYIVRELAETRRKFAERYAMDRSALQNPEYRECIAKIDSLLQLQSRALQADSRRIVSAPEPTSGNLPIISEEERAVTDEDLSPRKKSPNLAVVSAFSQRPPHTEQSRVANPSQTIRIIDQSPPSHVAPLNVRKATNAASGPATPRPPHVATFADPIVQEQISKPNASLPQQPRRLGPTPPMSSLSPISEDAAAQAFAARHARGLQNKRHGWFGGWKSRDDSAKNNTSLRGVDLSHRPSRQDSADTDLRTRDVSIPTAIPSTKVSVRDKRPGFLALFRKKKPQKTEPGKMALLDNNSDQSQTALSQASSRSQSSSRKHGFYHHMAATRSRITNNGTEEDRDLGIQRPWLLRIFNLKPPSQVMCFRISRGRVRSEVVRLLRSWKTAGIHDVIYDRHKNLVFARLTADNYLHLKEAAFVAQLFVVLEHGRPANLCVARFILRQGAQSSFRVVVPKIEQAMRKKGFIVEDSVKKKEMEGMLIG